MKKTALLRSFAIVAIATALLWSCQNTEQNTDIKPTKKPSGAKVALGCSVYSLVLGGNSGTPVPAFASFIHKVDPCTGNTGYVSQIKNSGITPINAVTGLSNIIGSPGGAWGTTGINSNFPARILKIAILSGSTSIGPVTVFGSVVGPKIYLQDLENDGTNYFAIKEGTNQIMRVNVSTGVCTNFAAPPVNQLTGLTLVGSDVFVISGNTNANCPGFSGDIFRYNSIGALLGVYTYNNLPINSSWTMKELGFHFDTCCGIKKFMVGSAGIPSVISFNQNISCGSTNPTFMNNIKPTYDFMAE